MNLYKDHSGVNLKKDANGATVPTYCSLDEDAERILRAYADVSLITLGLQYNSLFCQDSSYNKLTTHCGFHSSSLQKLWPENIF